MQVGALVLQRLDALVEFGQIDRRRRARRLCVDRSDRELRVRLTLDPRGKSGTLLRVSEQAFGRVDEKLRQELRDGWMLLLGEGLKGYVERQK